MTVQPASDEKSKRGSASCTTKEIPPRQEAGTTRKQELHENEPDAHTARHCAIGVMTGKLVADCGQIRRVCDVLFSFPMHPILILVIRPLMEARSLSTLILKRGFREKDRS